MSSALAWGLLGVAVLAAPGRAARPSAAGARSAVVARSTVGARSGGGAGHRADRRQSLPRFPPPDVDPGRDKSQRAGPLIAGVGAGAACVAVLGASRGAVAGAVVGVTVWIALGWLQRRPVPGAPDPALPLVLDLTAAALRAGQPLADALALAAGAARDDVAADLRRVSRLCRLGAEPAQAWAAVARDGPLSAVAPVAVRSAHSGIRVAGAFERLAAELRAEQAARRAARASRAGVTALGPLAACFLPAFLCLGVVPVIVGIATTALGVLPGGP